ncbi:MAG: hypothetical protein N2316_02025 [Spirochaetes bacterium]|nr:hypothetical protein [Spirochaetota bacterium]
MEEKIEKISADESTVINYVEELLAQDDITATNDIAGSENSEKQIALEFIKSYVQFLQELVENDLKNNLIRSDVEIRDLISHVNIMMKKRYETPFIVMVRYSVSHYRNMQSRLLAELGKDKQ